MFGRVWIYCILNAIPLNGLRLAVKEAICSKCCNKVHHEEHHLEEHPALQFHEAVVGYCIGEVTLEVDPDKMQIVVLEIVESAKVKHDQNRHNLAVGRAGRRWRRPAALPEQRQRYNIPVWRCQSLSDLLGILTTCCNILSRLEFCRTCMKFL